MIDYFNAITRAQTEAQAAQALRDWHNDISGVDVGRMTRTAIPDNDTLNDAKSKRKDDTALDIILSSIDYDQMFADTQSRATDARSRGEDIGNRISALQEREDAAMQDILDRAVTMPNGRKAFLAANGEARTIDGKTLDPALVAGIDWTGRPTWEQYQTQSQRLEALDDLADRNAAFLNEVGGVQDRLDDDDRPTPDELRALNEQLSGVEDGFDTIETELDKFSASPTTQPTLISPVAATAIPDFG